MSASLSDPLGSVRNEKDLRDRLRASPLTDLRRGRVKTLQVKIGKRCNLAGHHCHVESGPLRTEKLSLAGCRRVLELLALNPDVETLDLTGGAPELHEGFRDLVRGARELGRRVIDRCNLTVLFEPGQEDTAEFLAECRVEVVASLPCYTPENVEDQRGRNVFDRSIKALQRLNALGYGQGDDERTLNLVYNPGGAFLPPEQDVLEAEFRERLGVEHGIIFDRLLTLTNMPIKRFAHSLERDGEYDEYMSLLVNHFNPDTLPDLMCRSLVSVDHRGHLFDCDFNQACELPVPGTARDIWQIDDLSQLQGEPIRVGTHCFGCTAGSGSSCGGALS
ncbi:MAG: arsenosugar biosynthesis radical SAM (seleno)protein ArsS [Myxococcota bacterium]|nr:arsenosugar biosynthesis radical SAM (seleno)protein ArsS [Myxococcota bacterium]